MLLPIRLPYLKVGEGRGGKGRGGKGGGGREVDRGIQVGESATIQADAPTVQNPLKIKGKLQRHAQIHVNYNTELLQPIA